MAQPGLVEILQNELDSHLKVAGPIRRQIALLAKDERFGEMARLSGSNMGPLVLAEMYERLIGAASEHLNELGMSDCELTTLATANLPNRPQEEKVSVPEDQGANQSERWSLDDETKTLRIGNKNYELGPKSYQLVKIMSGRPGEIFLKNDLIPRLGYDPKEVGNKIGALVSTTRGKFHEDADNAKILITVRTGKEYGYKLNLQTPAETQVADVMEVKKSPPENLKVVRLKHHHRTVTIDGKTIRLSRGELALLDLIEEKKGNPPTKREIEESLIFEHAGKTIVASKGTVENLLNGIRGKTKAVGIEDDLIVTKRHGKRCEYELGVALEIITSDRRSDRGREGGKARRFVRKLQPWETAKLAERIISNAAPLVEFFKTSGIKLSPELVTGVWGSFIESGEEIKDCEAVLESIEHKLTILSKDPQKFLLSNKFIDNPPVKEILQALVRITPTRRVEFIKRLLGQKNLVSMPTSENTPSGAVLIAKI